MFLFPQPDAKAEEGTEVMNPIVLQGIDKNDFEQLLNVLFHRKYGNNAGPLPSNVDEWVSVLRLSTMWMFDGIREATIRALESLPMAAIDKLIYAMKYDIRQWLLPSLLLLARRPEPISVEEGRRMGFETALKLASVREKLKLESFESSTSCSRGHSSNYTSYRLVVGKRDPVANTFDFTPMLRTAFDLK
ncbi:hypothetical protein ID866_12380 [Astraeus odoratus]|nr:hypothetical protein ID866_12380 [Astraeus odoratus]